MNLHNRCQMKYISSILLLLLGSVHAFPQTTKIDSLKLLLSESDQTVRQHILYELTYEYVDLDYKKALMYASQGIALAQEREDTFNIVRLGRLKSLAFRRLNHLDSSLILSLSIHPIAVKHGYLEELKHILNGLAVVYVSKAHYDKALEFFLESLELRKKHGDSLEISIALQNVGFVFYQLEEYNKALFYFDQALMMRRYLDNRYDLDVLLINMSLCYLYQNNIDKAQKFLKEAVSTCKNQCSDFFLSQVELTVGLIMMKGNNLSGAEEKFLNSLSLAKKVGHERLQLDNIISLTEIYCLKNNLHAAEKYLKEAEFLINSGSPFNREIIELYKLMITVYKRSKDFEKVMHYQSKYISLKDSIYSKELTTNLMKLETDFVERENIAKIASQNKISNEPRNN